MKGDGKVLLSHRLIHSLQHNRASSNFPSPQTVICLAKSTVHNSRPALTPPPPRRRSQTITTTRGTAQRRRRRSQFDSLQVCFETVRRARSSGVVVVERGEARARFISLQFCANFCGWRSLECFWGEAIWRTEHLFGWRSEIFRVLCAGSVE